MSRFSSSFFTLRTAAVVVIIAAAASVASAANTLTAFYDPATGVIELKALDGNGQPATMNVSAFQLLSGSQYLSGSAASIPSAAFSFGTVLNTDTSNYFTPARPYAEIYATALTGTLFTSTWSLGPVAQTGLSQSDVNSGFASNPDLAPPAQAGRFNYETDGSNWFAGAITVVPEPAGTAILTAVPLVLVAAGRLRSRPKREPSC